jgi:aminotransferase
MRHNNPKHLLSNSGKGIAPSGIRKFFDIVYSMPDCISLGVGEPDFTTPWHISEAAVYAIKNGYTHYTPNKGLLELRELISDYTQKKYNVTYNHENEILITMGVSQALDLALRSLIDPGDEIIHFEPCYVSYKANIEMLNGVPVTLQTYSKNGFKIDIENLKKAITPKTKAILINYPSNPTGTTIDKNTLEQIADIALKSNIIIISDEIYSTITYKNKHESIASIPGMKERTIYLNGFSKSFAMTGWRIGYIAAPSYIMDIILKIHQYTAICAPALSQYAAIEAIESGEKSAALMNKEYERRRNFISNRFNEIGLTTVEPEGAFYVFPDISSVNKNADEFAMQLLKQEKVAVVPGDVFGKSGSGHIRCSFATSMDNIKEALIRIERFTS